LTSSQVVPLTVAGAQLPNSAPVVLPPVVISIALWHPAEGFEQVQPASICSCVSASRTS
jgi:hypothetical protein